MKMTYKGVVARVLEVLVTVVLGILLSGMLFKLLTVLLGHQEAAMAAGLLGGFITMIFYRVVIGPFCKGLRGGSKF